MCIFKNITFKKDLKYKKNYNLTIKSHDVTFKKDLEYFYSQKRAFSKNCHFKKI